MEEIVEEKLRKIILRSAEESFSPLIEEDPKLLETPLFQKFVKACVLNLCKSFKRAYVV
jgi:hypothetical protein